MDLRAQVRGYETRPTATPRQLLCPARVCVLTRHLSRKHFAPSNSALPRSRDRKSPPAWQQSVRDLQFRYSLGLLCTSENPSAV